MRKTNEVNGKIHVAIFASSFANRTGSGTAKHFETVTRLMCANPNLGIDLTLLCNSVEQFDYLRAIHDYKKAKLILLPKVKGKYLRSSRQFYKFSLFERENKFDILHFSVPRFYPFFWLFPAKKFVCTFHAGGDVVNAKDQFIFSREIYNRVAKLFNKRLDLIVAASEIGAQEIADVYGINENRIEVMYPGTDDIWILKPDPTKKSRDGKKIIMIIGRWLEYKNIQMVSKALRDSSNIELKNYFFVFVGKKISDNRYRIETDLINVNKSYYETIEYLSDQEYVNLICESSLVVVPSLNEGYSHPVFDAFSFGTNVLFHKPSPAAKILEGKKGVIAADMKSSSNFLHQVQYALNKEKSTTEENRDFLTSIGATWIGLTQKYVDSYKKILGYN